MTVNVLFANPKVIEIRNLKNGVKISWKKIKGAAGYRVFCRERNYGPWKAVGDTEETSLYVRTSNGKKALRSGDSYCFTIRCIKAIGSDVYTSDYDINGTQWTFLGQTAFTKAVCNKAGLITMQWNKVYGSTGYEIQYSLSKDFSSESKIQTIDVINSNNSSIKFYSSAKGKTLYFRVRKFICGEDQTGYSVWSKVQEVKVK